MDYFVMSQDKRIMNAPKLTFPSQVETPKHLDLNPYLGKMLLINVKSSVLNEYPDYMEALVNFKAPVMFISDKVKKIVSIYQRNITFQLARLIERDRGHQEVYHVMDVPEVDCISESTVRDLGGNVKELILDEEKIGVNRIFRVKGYEKRLIVRLDVAESLLRRDAAGICFEKVKVKEGL